MFCWKAAGRDACPSDPAEIVPTATGAQPSGNKPGKLCPSRLESRTLVSCMTAPAGAVRATVPSEFKRLTCELVRVNTLESTGSRRASSITAAEPDGAVSERYDDW